MMKILFFSVVRIVLWMWLATKVRHRKRLAVNGAAILVANHNSHLDALVIMGLFPIHNLPRPVAAVDYFYQHKLVKWFAENIIGIIALERRKTHRDPQDDPFAIVHHALQKGEKIIFFPEGTRGEPERLSAIKPGIAKLAAHHPNVPIIPILLCGLGKSMPKGSHFPLPFVAQVFVCNKLYSSPRLLTHLQSLFNRFTQQLEKKGKLFL